ncbi:hypothetical protein AVEN_14748-1 [Araneus ventricosus]|uniref:RNase H type-1 domain-containing protein n=1 Tax=Araneus ventricosus TaxID=182803 RepID=A0A4Y2M9M0_ARAVE|nr:hypothetical protein AVEN_14748-1 [Araneus ventricosus]
MLRIPPLGISKIYKTVSNEAIRVLTGSPPLDIKASIEKETLDSIVISKTTLENEDFANFDFEHRLPPWQNKMTNWKFYNQEMDGDNIFTDGSRIEDKVGCAFVNFRHGIEVESRKIRLSDGATVFKAEVVATKEAVEYIREKDMSNVKLISVSRSALMALNSPTEKRKTINSMKERINGNIDLYWVKAHQSIIRDEEADTLMKEATRLERTGYFFSDVLLAGRHVPQEPDSSARQLQPLLPPPQADFPLKQRPTQVRGHVLPNTIVSPNYYYTPGWHSKKAK